MGEKDFCFVANDTVRLLSVEYKVLETYNALTDTWTERKWSKKAVAPNYMDITGNNYFFGIGKQEYILTFVRKKHTYKNTLWEFDPNTISWKRKGDLPLTGNDTLCAFAIGDRGFVLRGKDSFLEYNMSLTSRPEGTEIVLPEKYLTPVFVVDGKYYFFSQHEFWEFAP